MGQDGIFRTTMTKKKFDKQHTLWLLLKLIKEEDSLTRAVTVKMIIEELEKIK